MEFTDLSVLGKQFSRALLMNARGNSGVIFSQIIKGFVSVFKENSTELTIGEFVDALAKAKDSSYKAVMTPIEGTILTVIRVTSEKITEKRNTYKSIEELCDDVVKEAEDILAKTPDFLPELKNAGVVDSGGYGLVCFFKGIKQSLSLKENASVKPKEQKQPVQKKAVINPKFVDNNDGFGYCCEFIAKLGSKVVLDQPDKQKLDVNELKKQLLEIGDSLAVVNDDDILKVHVHSINPFKVLEIGQKYGEFSKVKVENMTFQFLERNPGLTLQKSSKANKELPQKPAIIVTAPTKTLADVFKNDLAVNYVINCEKNGNPSIQEFIDALTAVNSAKVLLIVDDGNMVLAAKEAISIFMNTNKGSDVRLINSTDIAGTYALTLAYNPEGDFSDNCKNLFKLNKSLPIAKISRSVKMVKYSHIDVKKNDYIGIISKKIISSSKNIDSTIKQTLFNLSRINKKVKTAYVFYGVDVNPSTLNLVEKEMMEKYASKINFIPSKESVYLFHFVMC